MVIADEAVQRAVDTLGRWKGTPPGPDGFPCDILKTLGPTCFLVWQAGRLPLLFLPKTVLKRSVVLVPGWKTSGRRRQTRMRSGGGMISHWPLRHCASWSSGTAGAVAANRLRGCVWSRLLRHGLGCLETSPFHRLLRGSRCQNPGWLVRRGDSRVDPSPYWWRRGRD